MKSPFEAFRVLREQFAEGLPPRETTAPDSVAMRRALEAPKPSSKPKAKKAPARRPQQKGPERRSKQLNLAVMPSVHARFAGLALALGLSHPDLLDVLLDAYHGGRDA